MKVKSKYFPKKECCGDHELYGLSTWKESDYVCADDFLNFLIENCDVRENAKY